MPSHSDSRRLSGTSSSSVSFRHHPLALACAGLALVGSFGAAGQDSAPTPTGLDTITVTADARETFTLGDTVQVGWAPETTWVLPLDASAAAAVVDESPTLA